MKEIKTRVNLVYYQDEYDNIKELILYKDKKVKMKEAREYFLENGILFNTIIKVMLEDLLIEIPEEDLENYKKTII